MSAFPYRTQAVRDLAWACFAPPLLHIEQLAEDGQNVAACGLSLNPERLRWLEQLDRDPRPLLEHLAQGNNTRLGIYFERLWQFFLRQDAGVELLAQNLPVRDGKRTLGEFDIIYWCRERQRHFHLELAIKYFLGYRRLTSREPHSRWSEWLGPNANDRLDLKLEQLLQRQARLGQHPLARAQLGRLGIPHLVPEIAIKGYLFQSIGDPLPPPIGFNSELALSRWLPLGELERHLAGLETGRFALLPKARWLSPAQVGPAGEFFDRPALAHRLQSLLAAGGRARLVAGLGSGGSELCRFFVTANDWPAAQDRTNIFGSTHDKN
jgi:hypothetical protein